MPSPEAPKRPPTGPAKPLRPAAPSGPRPPQDETSAALREIAAGLQAIAAAINYAWRHQASRD